MRSLSRRRRGKRGFYFRTSPPRTTNRLKKLRKYIFCEVYFLTISARICQNIIMQELVYEAVRFSEQEGIRDIKWRKVMTNNGKCKKIQQEFGELIRAKRKEKRYTQEQLSELAGITDVYLRDLERGSYTATWVICLKICDALDIDIRELQNKYIAPEIAEMKKYMKKDNKEKTLC